MGFLDSIFGGGEQKNKSVTKPVDMTPPELSGLRSPFADALKALLGTSTGGGLSGIPAPTGPLAAPMGAGETAALSTLTQDDPLQAQRRALLSSTMQGNFLPGQPGANPFLQASIEAAQRPTLQGLEDTLSRVLPGRFTQAGQFVNPQGSSPFDFAAARATGDVAREVGDIATRMSFGSHEAERGRQQETIQLGQQEVQTMVTNLQAQALPRLIEDMGIERGQKIFQERLQALLQALGVITQTPLQTVASQQKSTGSQTTQTGIVPATAQLINALPIAPR